MNAQPVENQTDANLDVSIEEFLEKLGPGQFTGMQALSTQCLGEIQLKLFERKNHLELEVIRARNLINKPGTKLMPFCYVKLYLMEGKICIEKQKTRLEQNQVQVPNSNEPTQTQQNIRNVDPVFQQTFVFMENHKGIDKWVQFSIWSQSIRKTKQIIGVGQLSLTDLKISNPVAGWYKLYNSDAQVAHSTSVSTNMIGPKLSSATEKQLLSSGASELTLNSENLH